MTQSTRRTTLPFGAGIPDTTSAAGPRSSDDEGPSPVPSGRASGFVDDPGRREPGRDELGRDDPGPTPDDRAGVEPEGAGDRGPLNLVAGRPGPARSGAVFRSEDGGTWPRSATEDLGEALDLLAEASTDAPTSVEDADLDPLAHALASDSALQEDLAAALGDIAESAHFQVTGDRLRAELQRLAGGSREVDVPDADVVALAPHWSEPLARAAARAVRAARRGSTLLVLTDPCLPRFGLTLAGALARVGVASERIAVLHGDGSDVLRAVAARPDVGVDAVRPSAFTTGIAGTLAALRDDAQATEMRPRESDEGSNAEGTAEGWFGRGVVARPAAPLRVRIPLGSDVVVGEVDWRGREDDAVRLPADDLGEAAEEVVERAFGRGVLGGFSSDAAARVVVERGAFSRFTECLLDVLSDADGDPWFDAPAWALRSGGRTRRSLAAGRRIGLDEGATLVHERRSVAGDPEPRGLVFTNVEPRMRLGGALRVPGVLALVRGPRPS
ncbi:MAG: hypothetical protein AAGB93_03825 [Planctomycetota bacterium]